MFAFDGGTLSAARIETLKITDDELTGFRFCARDEAAELRRPYVWQRAANALDALNTGQARYFHRATSAATRAAAACDSGRSAGLR